MKPTDAEMMKLAVTLAPPGSDLVPAGTPVVIRRTMVAGREVIDIATEDDRYVATIWADDEDSYLQGDDPMGRHQRRVPDPEILRLPPPAREATGGQQAVRGAGRPHGL